MAIERRAHATWEGDLRSGSGKFDVGSGAISGQEVTFASRFDAEPGGKTSPEELIAAAHATCFSMALSGGLALARHFAGVARDGRRTRRVRGRRRDHEARR